MEVSIASAADYDRLVALFSKNDFSLQRPEWFRWKHLENPLGDSIVLKVEDEGGEIVATISLLQQKYHYRGKEYLGLQAVDGVISPEVRGKRLFSQMMAAILAYRPEEQGDGVFFIGFPSLVNSVKAFESSRWSCLTNFSSTTYLLDPAKLSGRPGGWLLSRVMSWPLALARAAMFKVPGAERYSVRQADQVPPGFDARFRRPEKVSGDRSGRVFTWRVLQNPRDQLDFFLIEDASGELTGYAVGRLSRGDYEVLEWGFQQNQREGLSALLSYLYAAQEAESVTFVGFNDFDSGWQAPPLGIRRRPAGGSVFVHGLEKLDLPADPAFWNLTVLDSDW